MDNEIVIKASERLGIIAASCNSSSKNLVDSLKIGDSKDRERLSNVLELLAGQIVQMAAVLEHYRKLDFNEVNTAQVVLSDFYETFEACMGDSDE